MSLSVESRRLSSGCRRVRFPSRAPVSTECGSAARLPALEAGDRGFESLHSDQHGSLVQRQGRCFTRSRSGFNSSATYHNLKGESHVVANHRSYSWQTFVDVDRAPPQAATTLRASVRRQAGIGTLGGVRGRAGTTSCSTRGLAAPGHARLKTACFTALTQTLSSGRLARSRTSTIGSNRAVV